MSDQLKFFLLETLGDRRDNRRCVLRDNIRGANEESWRLRRGEPASNVWPEDATIVMGTDDGRPRLDSLVGNVSSLLIVAPPLKELIEAHCVGTPLEMLALTILDSRKRVLSKHHVVVNPLGTFDCLDLMKTRVVRDDDDSDKILAAKEESFVLDGSKMAEAPQLFRPLYAPSSYIIGRKLARAMYDAKLSNIMWRQLPVSKTD